MSKIASDDPRPPYVQIADEIRAEIDAGELRPGEKLPSGRELSDKYGVAGMTVQRAIQLLRAEGRVASWQGRGSFVTDATPDDPADALVRIERLEQTVRELAKRVDSLDARSTETGRS